MASALRDARIRASATPAAASSATPRACADRSRPICSARDDRAASDLARQSADGGRRSDHLRQQPDGLIEARITPECSARTWRGKPRSNRSKIIRRRIDPNGTSEVVDRPPRRRPHRRAGAGRLRSGAAEGAHRPNRVDDLPSWCARSMRRKTIAAGRMPPGTMVGRTISRHRQRGGVVERRPRFTGERLHERQRRHRPANRRVRARASSSTAKARACSAASRASIHRSALRHSARQSGADRADDQRADLRRLRARSPATSPRSRPANWR